MEIRIRETGEIVNERRFKAMHPNTSIEIPISEAVINSLGADIVFEGPQASNLEWWQISQRDGVHQLNNKWYTKYIAGPVFATQLEQDTYISQKTQEKTENLYKTIIDQAEQRLSDFAATRGYKSILSLCTYATDPNPQFAAEGQYGVEIRSNTWKKLYEMLDEVNAGTRELPNSFADIEPELPILVWPE